MRCVAITRAEEKCKGKATHGSFCYQHSPETAQERKRNARRGGKAGGNGRPSGLSETGKAKRWIKDLVGRLLRSEVERDVATAAFMGLNTLSRFIELERRIREQEELEERITALEEAKLHERRQIS